MFIASKFLYSVSTLTLDIVKNCIFHKKFTSEELNAQENQIMLALGYDVDYPTVYDFIELMVNGYVKLNYKVGVKLQVVSQIHEMALYLAYVISYDYNMLRHRLG